MSATPACARRSLPRLHESGPPKAQRSSCPICGSTTPTRVRAPWTPFARCRPLVRLYLPELLADSDPDVRLLGVRSRARSGRRRRTALVVRADRNRAAGQCLRRRSGSPGRDRRRNSGSRPSRVAPNVFRTIRSSVSPSRSSPTACAACRCRLVVESRLLDAEEYRRLCDYLYRHTGMAFTEARRYFVERRVEERMIATGSSSFASYFARLRANLQGELES